MQTVPVIDPKRFEALINLPIKSGGHNSFEEGACVMEAVAFLAGEKHSDAPACACPVVSAFLRHFNDRLPSDAVRSKLLTPLIPLLVGSRSTKAVEEKRRWLMVNWSVHTFAPRWMELANKGEAAQKMRDLPEVTAENHYAVAEQIRAIRNEAFGEGYDSWYAWRRKYYDAVYASVTKALKAGTLKLDPATAAAAAATTDAAATAATTAAATATTAADAATTAADAADAATTATAATAAATTDAAATTAATAAAATAATAADAAADAATTATAAATDAAAATAAKKKFPKYDTDEYWAWRDAFKAEFYRLTYARFEAALGPTVERSRQDAVDLVRAALAITE